MEVTVSPIKNKPRKIWVPVVRNDLNKWIIGSHIGFSGKIFDTISETVNSGMASAQFFMGGRQSFDRTKISDLDLNNCKTLLARFPVAIFTHFPYIANLAGNATDKILAWNGSDECDKKMMRVLKSLEYELNTIARLGLTKSGVVIHPGTFRGRSAGLKAIATSINKINFQENSMLLLENSAGQGDSLATTLAELKTILDSVEKKDHVGVCIDTCHLFAYGDYDLRESKEVSRFFQDFDRILGLEKLKLIHLNDSIFPLKCRKDRHECIGLGQIWGKSMDSLILLLGECAKLGIPAVLETTDRDFPVLRQLEASILV